MRHRTLFIAFALLVAFTPSAEASLLRGDGSQYGAQHRLSRFVAKMKVPMPGTDVTVVLGECPYFEGALGCVSSNTPDVVYMRSSLPAEVLYHELGHVFDLGMDPAQRDWFLSAVFKTDQPWRGAVAGEPSPAEWFADLYAACAEWGVNYPRGLLLDGRVVPFGYVGPSYTPAAYRTACRRIKYYIPWVGFT